MQNLWLLSNNKIYDKKIHGRKCIVKEIQSQEGKNFFDKHHIQGCNNLGIVFFGLLKSITIFPNSVVVSFKVIFLS